MSRLLKSIALVAGAATIGGALLLSDDLKADAHLADIVKERQELMKTMGKSFGPLVAILKNESTDLEAAAAAAQTMSDSMAKSADLFPEGTAAGEVEGSRAKPEVWSKNDEFDEAADALVKAAADLAAAAKTGDVDTFKAAFEPVGMACGGCHESKGAEGGKFRVAKES